jgi:iron complex outermembrane receptor protein
MKIPFNLVILFLISYSIFAQNHLTGVITDKATGLPLPGAEIYLLDQNTGTISNDKGEYKLNNLPNGELKIQYSYLSYKTVVKTIFIKNNDQNMNISLEPTVIHTQEVVISGGSISSQHENAIKIETISAKEINSAGSPSFMETLASVPGIDIISKGPGVSKPVIRGLSMTNILLLNNGVKIENYQFSENHPFIVDEFGIEKVEIIKGPASLIYGSDAVGGVINLIKERPAPAGKIMGDYNASLHSNTTGLTTNFGIKGNSNQVFWGVRAGLKSHADYRDGKENFVPNTRFNTQSFKIQAGLIKPFGTFKLFYDYNYDKLGMCTESSIALISKRGRKNDVWYQDLHNHLLSSRNRLFLGNFKIDINAALQMNNRKLQTSNLTPAFKMVDMDLTTVNCEVRVNLPSGEKLEYIIGWQGMYKNNSNNDAPNHVLPNAEVNDISFFGLVQYSLLHNLKAQSGIRYDIHSVSTVAEEGKPAIDHDYQNPSFSAGLTYSLNDILLLRGNFATAYRTPNIAELSQNGMHGDHYEQGNPDLNAQLSNETDISLHYHSEYATFDLSGFYNSIKNYIYISPTDDTIASGDIIYRYSQTAAGIYGYEAGLNIFPYRWLNFVATYASLVGKQKDNSNLPFIPQNKLRASISANKENLWLFNSPYIKISAILAFRQDNPALFETETNSYYIVNLSSGSEWKLNKQSVFIDLIINNLFDQYYIDHLSTLKGIGFYNMGRDISLNIKIPIQIK